LNEAKNPDIAHEPVSVRVPQEGSGPVSVLKSVLERNTLRLRIGRHQARAAADDLAARQQEFAGLLGSQFGVAPSSIGIKPASIGRSGDQVFLISISGEMAAVLKVFRDAEMGQQEAKALERLEGLKQFNAVKNLGTAELVETDGNRSCMMLMECAPGDAIGASISNLPVDSAQREQAFKDLKPAFRRIGEAFGEFHAHFASGSAMTPEWKKDWLEWALGKVGLAAEAAPPELREASAAVLAQVAVFLREQIGPALMEAELPATAYHGDANLMNFVPTSEGTRVFDVGSLLWSIDPETGQGMRTGANDLGRFTAHLQSLLSQSADSPKQAQDEADALERELMKGYAKYPQVKSDQLRSAITLARIEFEMAVLRYEPAHTANALNRLQSLVARSPFPPNELAANEERL
jgi:hypothetical protein